LIFSVPFLSVYIYLFVPRTSEVKFGSDRPLDTDNPFFALSADNFLEEEGVSPWFTYTKKTLYSLLTHPISMDPAYCTIERSTTKCFYGAA